MARIGFHPIDVWQFWQGTSSAPCGLRLLANGVWAKAEIQHNKANVRTICRLIEVTPDPRARFEPMHFFGAYFLTATDGAL